jgi:hypothetical protein
MVAVFPYFLSIVHNFACFLYTVNTEHLNTMTTQVLELLRIDPQCGRRNSLSHPPQFADITHSSVTSNSQISLKKEMKNRRNI